MCTVLRIKAVSDSRRKARTYLLPTAINGSGRKCRSGVGIAFPCWIAARHDGDMQCGLLMPFPAMARAGMSGYESRIAT